MFSNPVAETEAVTATQSLAAMYWPAAIVFVLAFIAIVSEKVDKTKVALLAGTTMIILPILTQSDAFHSHRFGVDYNVVFLLVGMMMIVNMAGKSGIFEWAAIRSAKLGRGNPIAIMVIFSIFTAVSSAFLDNVTTVLLLAPVTLLIADELEVDPIPFLICEALASNIGGTATLIGDPPNIIISSRAGLGFMDFIWNLAPIVVIMMIAFTLVTFFLFRNKLSVDPANKKRIMEMNESKLVKDKSLAWKSLGVLGVVIAAFALHGVLHVEPATVALIGASVLLLIGKQDVHEILAEVEWPTIFFFIGLFIMVGGIVKVGIIEDISQLVIDITKPSKDDMFVTSMVMLWFSGVFSAVVDNIPYVATMSPLVLDMANSVYHGGLGDPASLPPETVHNSVLMPVWWSLALGSCLGGNGTPIGASANVIVLGIAKKSGTHISFLRFMAYGVPTMILSLLFSTVYIYLRYYM